MTASQHSNDGRRSWTGRAPNDANGGTEYKHDFPTSTSIDEASDWAVGSSDFLAIRMRLQDLYLNPRQRGRLLMEFLNSCESEAV